MATTFEYKGNFYKKLFSGLMKIGAKWLDCVVYKSTGDNKIYVREKLDFFEKFKSIE